MKRSNFVVQLVLVAAFGEKIPANATFKKLCNNTHCSNCGNNANCPQILWVDSKPVTEFARLAEFLQSSGYAKFPLFSGAAIEVLPEQQSPSEYFVFPLEHSEEMTGFKDRAMDLLKKPLCSRSFVPKQNPELAMAF